MIKRSAQALHKRARTTPAVRAKIAASREPVAVLAQHYNVSEATIRKRRTRDDFHDRPHTAHRLQTMVVVRKFIYEGMLRSAYRVLVRHGVFCQPVEAYDKPGHKPLPNKTTRRYLFVVIDRTPTKAQLARKPFCMPCTKPTRSGSPS